MAENFPNLAEHKSNIQEAEQTPNRIKPKKSTLRDIIINLLKTKEKVLKAVRKERCLSYSSKTIQTANFSNKL